MWPICGTGYQAMFHRVDVDVIAMGVEIGFVAQRVFPISRLPDCSFSTRIALQLDALTAQTGNKTGLDGPPASRIIIIALRQAPNGVQVIRQHHHRLNREWPLCFHRAYRLTQYVDIPQQKIRSPVTQRDREKIRPTRQAISSIEHHWQSIGSGGNKALVAGWNAVKSGGPPGRVGLKDALLMPLTRLPDFAARHPGYANRNAPLCFCSPDEMKWNPGGRQAVLASKMRR